ncbi:MAG: YIP1 family protein [Chloroflexi bacterium]|nr:YIP1 family protein [Chloroflexota bacterium]
MERIMGVLTLKAPVYKEIAEDKSATTMAAIIVVITTLVSGFFKGLVHVNETTGAASVSIGGAVLGAILTLIFGLIGWVIAAWVLQLVAGWFGGKTDTGEMMRVTGHVEVFSLIAVLNVLTLGGTALACVTGLVGLIVGILKLVGYVIGVREAAEFTTGKAVVTALIAAIINFLIVAIPVGALMATLAVAMAIGG